MRMECAIAERRRPWFCRGAEWKSLLVGVLSLAAWMASPCPAFGEGPWEITPESEQALARGLEWLARNQGPEGNWESNDLGLVSTGVLAFLAAGHLPGRGRYGETVAAGDGLRACATPSRPGC